MSVQERHENRDGKKPSQYLSMFADPQDAELATSVHSTKISCGRLLENWMVDEMAKTGWEKRVSSQFPNEGVYTQFKVKAEGARTEIKVKDGGRIHVSVKGENFTKQVDLCLVSKDKVCLYEVKLGYNFDRGKAKSESDNMRKAVEALRKSYPDMKVEGWLVLWTDDGNFSCFSGDKTFVMNGDTFCARHGLKNDFEKDVVKPWQEKNSEYMLLCAIRKVISADQGQLDRCMRIVVDEDCKNYKSL